jgi:hypothetical protein
MNTDTKTQITDLANKPKYPHEYNRQGVQGAKEITEVAKRLGEPPGRHPHLGAAKCEIAKDTAHALNRTRDLRIMSSAL